MPVLAAPVTEHGFWCHDSFGLVWLVCLSRLSVVSVWVTDMDGARVKLAGACMTVEKEKTKILVVVDILQSKAWMQ
jgi:hypothetical protein